MSIPTAIKVEDLSKQYRLGNIGTGTISHDINRFIAKVRGKEDPTLKIGDTNDRTIKGDSDYVWALRDIKFEVKQGEILGVIGKNGAGKSTLLKILSKVTGPTTGSIKANGRIASLLEVGTGFHPELTGRENIFLNGAILGMTKPEIRSKLDEIVDFAGVERYLDTPVKRYSSGMMVRLGFAVAAHLEPEILVVDEVLAVGDAEFQKKAIGKMQDVSTNQGRTVLFVSHNMESIKALCNRAIILDKGRIVYESSDVEKAVDYYYNNEDYIENVFHRKNVTSDLRSITITDFKIKNKPRDVTVGQKIVFSLAYQIEDTSYLNKNVSIAIGIKDINGNMKSLLSNFLLDQEIPLRNSGEIICEIPKLTLQAGDYKLNIMIRAGSLNLCWVQDAYFFRIHEGDFFNVGISNYNFPIGTFIEQSWKHFDA
jgi:lipopolysaccharide transport system ATP-binding protein